MIAGGTTCIADMYMHTGTIAQEIMKAGISANLSCGGVYFGAPEDFSPKKCNDCRKMEREFDKASVVAETLRIVTAEKAAPQPRRITA